VKSNARVLQISLTTKKTKIILLIKDWGYDYHILSSICQMESPNMVCHNSLTRLIFLLRSYFRI